MPFNFLVANDVGTTEAEALQAIIDARAEDAAEDAPLTPRQEIEEQFDPAMFDWTKIITSHVVNSLAQWETSTGQINGMAEHAMRTFQGDMYNAINDRFFNPSKETTRFLSINDVTEQQQGDIQSRKTDYYKGTQDGINELIEFGIQFMGGQMGASLSPAAPRGPGGGGRRGPSAQDIRNQFDIEQLSNSVDDLNRMLVFEPHSGAKKLAREYVEAVVRGKGEKKIDFETFVRSRIEKTSRFKSIYRNKPDALKAEQYMAPYFQQARGVARPDEAADLAIGGAQFGASTQAFQARLARTAAVTGSSPFINSLEGRLQDLNQVFKG